MSATGSAHLPCCLGNACRDLEAIEQRLGCRVDCIELSADYCIGARLLNRLTDDSFRKWTKWLIYGMSAIYVARGLWLLVME
jgi:hypothetical protein